VKGIGDQPDFLHLFISDDDALRIPLAVQNTPYLLAGRGACVRNQIHNRRMRQQRLALPIAASGEAGPGVVSSANLSGPAGQRTAGQE